MEGKPKEFVIGRMYHCSWAKNRGMVWRLVSFDIEKNTAKLKTPKTKKILNTKLSDLRDINRRINKKNNIHEILDTQMNTSLNFDDFKEMVKIKKHAIK